MKARMPTDKAVERIIRRETRQQIAEQIPVLTENITAVVLWSLHEQLGFGHDRLVKFMERFVPLYDDLMRHYEMSDEDDKEWLLKKKLEDECGIVVADLPKIVKIKPRIK